MKIKGYRFPCEVCNNSIDSNVQVFFRKNGEVSYARARHYGADKKFYNIQKSLECTNRKIREIDTIDPCQDSNNKSFDQTTTESDSKIGLMAGPKGFEPLTFSLEGWHAIRTASRTHIRHFKWDASTYNFTYRLVQKPIWVIILNTTQRSKNTKFSTFVYPYFFGAVDSSIRIKSRLHLINFVTNRTFIFSYLSAPFHAFLHLNLQPFQSPNNKTNPKQTLAKMQTQLVLFFNWAKLWTTILHLPCTQKMNLNG